MGLIDKVKSWFGYDSSISDGYTVDLQTHLPNWWSIGFSNYRYNERNFREFVENGYGRNPYVYMIVDRISRLVADVPFVICDADGNLIESPELERIIAEPNDADSWEEFVYKSISCYLATGNAILFETTPAGFRLPEQVNILLAQDTTIITENGEIYGKPKTYQNTDFGAIDAERVLHIRKPNILDNNNWGLSPLYSGQTVYEGSNNTFEAGANIHKNTGATGVLSPENSDDALTPVEQQELQNSWDSQSSGSKKLGKIHVSTTAMKFVQIGLDPAKLKLVELNIEYLRTICSLFGVDSSLFNDPANKTYNNLKEAQQAIYTNTVLPIAYDFYSQFSRWMTSKMGLQDVYMKPDKSSIPAMQEDENEKHKRINDDVKSGILTPEQARMILYPELDDNE